MKKKNRVLETKQPKYAVQCHKVILLQYSLKLYVKCQLIDFRSYRLRLQCMNEEDAFLTYFSTEKLL